MRLQQITITKFNDARNIICFTIKILQSNVPILSTRKIIIYKFIITMLLMCTLMTNHIH